MSDLFTAIGRRWIGALAVHGSSWSIAAIVVVVMVACATGDPMRLAGPKFETGDSDATMAAGGGAVAGQAPAAQASASDQANAAATETGDNGDAELSQLWQQRTTQLSSTDDYPIGPGDILTISVPQMEELQERKVRVTTTGTIELPLIGSVQAGGLTEEGLEAALDEKLSNFMYNPQASVFVDEYHNREVAVIGAINRPGLVLLTSPSETVLDVLTQAGGLSSAAADEIILIPVSAGGANMARRVSMVAYNAGGEGGATATATDASPGGAGAPAPGPAGTSRAGGPPTQIMPHQAGRPIAGGNSAIAARAQRVRGDQTAALQPDIASNALRMMPSNAHPLTIKVKSTSLTGAGKYINLPVRPGDVIVVPGGGNVMVVGWVETPGYFQVGSGLTVLGAIGAAGGPMYAADTKNITLIRSGKGGGKDTIAVNLDRVSKGQDPDLAVKANDVIDVPYSGWRIGPYIFYSVLSRMGIGGPAIPY